MDPSTSAAPGRIFISYRRAETDFPASWLYESLVAEFGREQVFKDVDSIELGDDFAQTIAEAVGSCEVLLALIGDRWSTIEDADGKRRLDDPNDFVRLELEAALQRRIKVVPILVGDVPMPRAQDLPPSLGAFVRRQALELSPTRFEPDVARLVRVLKRTLADAAAAREAAELQAAAEKAAADQAAAEKAAADQAAAEREAVERAAAERAAAERAAAERAAADQAAADQAAADQAAADQAAADQAAAEGLPPRRPPAEKAAADQAAAEKAAAERLRRRRRLRIGPPWRRPVLIRPPWTGRPWGDREAADREAAEREAAEREAAEREAAADRGAADREAAEKVAAGTVAPEQEDVGPQWSRRSRVVALAAAAVLLAVGTGYTVTRLSANNSTANTPAASGPSGSATSLPAGAALSDSQMVVPIGVGGDWELYLADTAHPGSLRRLTSIAGIDTSPVLSPDRRTMIWVHESDQARPTLRVAAASTAPARVICSPALHPCARVRSTARRGTRNIPSSSRWGASTGPVARASTCSTWTVS